MYRPQLGDTIKRLKDAFILHSGVCLGERNGQIWVAENNVGTGVQIITLEAFLKGNAIHSIIRFQGNEYQRSRIVPIVQSKIGTRYDLFTNNCEHFVSEVLSQKRESHQLQKGVVLSALLFCFIAAS
jgi:hypothetical protein